MDMTLMSGCLSSDGEEIYYKCLCLSITLDIQLLLKEESLDFLNSQRTHFHNYKNMNTAYTLKAHNYFKCYLEFSLFGIDQK